MITLLRRQAHASAVLRRSVLGIAHRGPVAPIVFTAGDGQLCARHRYTHLAIEHATRVAWPSSGTAALPLDALAEVEGRDDRSWPSTPSPPTAPSSAGRTGASQSPRVHGPDIETMGTFPRGAQHLVRGTRRPDRRGAGRSDRDLGRRQHPLRPQLPAAQGGPRRATGSSPPTAARS